MWKIEWDSKALKEAKKLDRDARKKIVEYLEKRVFGVIEQATIVFSAKQKIKL